MLSESQTQDQQQNLEQKSMQATLDHSEADLDLNINPTDKSVQSSATTTTASRPWLEMIATIALLGAGVAAGNLIMDKNQGPVAPAIATLPPRPVETTTLQVGAATQALELIGNVAAADQATVQAQTTGVVTQVWVDIGDTVMPGQPLISLDTSDQELALTEARASLVSAQSELARLETGTRPEVIAQRQAELRAAQAREQEARDNLRNVAALLPDLIAQRQAELEMTQAAEVEAHDNLERTRRLATEGALSQRNLIEAQTRATAATSDRLRATSALAMQRTENQQRLSQARAGLDAAISEQLRVTALLAEAATGPRQEDIEAQRGLVQAARSAVDQAELALERAVISTDVAGVVSDRPINVGDYVEMNRDVATVVNGDRLDVFLDVPERYSGQVGVGLPIELAASALPDWTSEAVVTGVVPITNSASRRQQIRVRLDTAPERLLPGMAMTGRLDLPASEAQFVVSRDALTRRFDQWVVFVVDANNQAQEVPVELVTDSGQTVAIASSDLLAGQTLVTNGGDGLRDGAAVQVTSSAQ